MLHRVEVARNIGLTVALATCMARIVFSDKHRPDFALLGLLTILAAAQVLSVDDALSGFSSPSVATLLGALSATTPTQQHPTTPTQYQAAWHPPSPPPVAHHPYCKPCWATHVPPLLHKCASCSSSPLHRLFWTTPPSWPCWYPSSHDGQHSVASPPASCCYRCPMAPFWEATSRSWATQPTSCWRVRGPL